MMRPSYANAFVVGAGLSIFTHHQSPTRQPSTYFPRHSHHKRWGQPIIPLDDAQVAETHVLRAELSCLTFLLYRYAPR